MYSILLVEDEYLVRQGVKKLIELSGTNFTVIGEAENGQEGIELAKKLCPDVIITDVKMPFLNGLEMTEQIKCLLERVKIIVLSAYSHYEYTHHAIKCGVYDYIMKPINRNEFNLLLIELNKKLEEENKRNIDVEEEKEDRSKPIQLALKYIENNFQKDIGLETVADYIGINTNYFSGLFKKEVGKNFIDYITKLRIRKAKEYLQFSQYKIYEVSDKVGYTSAKHFAKLFKEEVGMLPAEYRKMKKTD